MSDIWIRVQSALAENDDGTTRFSFWTLYCNNPFGNCFNCVETTGIMEDLILFFFFSIGRIHQISILICQLLSWLLCRTPDGLCVRIRFFVLSPPCDAWLPLFYPRCGCHGDCHSPFYLLLHTFQTIRKIEKGGTERFGWLCWVRFVFFQ